MEKMEKNDFLNAEMIVWGLGGLDNMKKVDGCATRLRCEVADPSLMDRTLLRKSGVSAILGEEAKPILIFGPRAGEMKAGLDAFLASGRPELTERPDFEGVTAGECWVGEDDADEVIVAPIDGKVALIAEAPDEVFSERMLGDGVVIFPTGNQVIAPCDATVEVFFDTKHALGLRTVRGTEMLIHVGIDTVNLKGQGFKSSLKKGDKVKKGDVLITLDLPYLEAHAKSTAVPVTFPDLPALRAIQTEKMGPITAGEKLVTIRSIKKRRPVDRK